MANYYDIDEIIVEEEVSVLFSHTQWFCLEKLPNS